ncbi:hypothetical protein QBC35DRAFT_359004, partial [Podospora australis]
MKRIDLPAADLNPDGESRTLTPGQRPPQRLSDADTVPSSGQRDFLPPEIMAIVAPSLRVGATSGACGMFLGAAAGIVRSAPPILFAAAAGGQWFALGSSYWASRLVAFNYMGGEDKLSSSQKIKGSAVAGGLAGTVGGLIRGPRNILPGAIMFSLLGAGGQVFGNRRAARLEAEGANPDKNKGFWNSKWSPVKSLSDDDYVKLLEEKLLRVEAEIAIVSDHIKDLQGANSETNTNS